MSAPPPEQVFLVGGSPGSPPRSSGPGWPTGPETPIRGPRHPGAGPADGGRRAARAGLDVPGGRGMPPTAEEAGGFSTPEAVARAVLEAQPRTELLHLKDGEQLSPLLQLVDESERERVGDVLGQYRLERMLGEGAMGRFVGPPRQPRAPGGDQGAPCRARPEHPPHPALLPRGPGGQTASITPTSWRSSTSSRRPRSGRHRPGLLRCDGDAGGTGASPSSSPASVPASPLGGHRAPGLQRAAGGPTTWASSTAT